MAKQNKAANPHHTAKLSKNKKLYKEVNFNLKRFYSLRKHEPLTVKSVNAAFLDEKVSLMLMVVGVVMIGR